MAEPVAPIFETGDDVVKDFVHIRSFSYEMDACWENEMQYNGKKKR
jgi:hypothetical protein